MTTEDCRALLGVIRAFIIQAPHTNNDLADLFDLLGQLEPQDKRKFWKWMGDHSPNIQRWLVRKGEARRAA